MSAVETLAAAQAAGVQVGVDGPALLIEADCAPPDSLLDALRRDKADILALLSASGTAEDAPTIAAPKSPDLHGLTLEELREAADKDWPIAREDPSVLEALANAIVTRRQRQSGERPPDWTEVCECAGCGPVFVWAGCPARVLACPWCFNRTEGRPIPRPGAVTCGTCSHFQHIDHPHLGRCACGQPKDAAGLWDTDRRACPRWSPNVHGLGT